MNRRSMGWLGVAAIALMVTLVLGGGWYSSRAAISAGSVPVAQTPEALPTLTAIPGPTISGIYEDPQGAFQVGILEGYTVSSVSGSPLFQSADGSLAYSVVQVPLKSENPLPEIGLVELTRQTLDNGEGFQTQAFTPMPGGGLQIAWTGRLSQGGAPPQPVSGTILTKQQGATVFVMAIAALDGSAPQVPQVVSLLSDSLTIL